MPESGITACQTQEVYASLVGGILSISATADDGVASADGHDVGSAYHSYRTTVRWDSQGKTLDWNYERDYGALFFHKWKTLIHFQAQCE